MEKNTMELNTTLLRGRWFSLTLIVLISLFLPVDGVCDTGIFFVHMGPLAPGSTRLPNQTILYQWNEQTTSLDQVWTLGKDIPAWDIDVYPGSGPVIIAQGDWFPVKLYVFWKDQVLRPDTVSLDITGRVSQYHYFDNADGSSQIQMRYIDTAQGKAEQFSFRRVTLEGHRHTSPPGATTEIRLAGPRARYGGREHDIVCLTGHPSGVLKGIHSDIEFDATSIPDSIVQSRPMGRWNLTVNEPSYRVLQSVPHTTGTTWTELLVHNRLSDTWSSIRVEGGETSPRPFNNWLIGIIADTNPKTSYETNKGYPPVLRETIVVIDPMTAHQFTVHLGKMSQVLWVEEDTVYYKTGSNLYRARIADDDFVDRTILISDFKVNYIHWAFRGSSE